MEVVAECLLHEEQKMNERTEPGTVSEKAMVVRPRTMKEDGTKVSLLWKTWPYQTELFRIYSSRKETGLQPCRGKEELLNQKQTKLR